MSLERSPYALQTSSNDVESGKYGAPKDPSAEYPDLPWVIQLCIRSSLVANPLNKVIFFLLWCCWNVFFIFPLFAAIMESLVAGITLASLGLLSGVMYYEQINFAKPESDGNASIEKIKHSLIHENVPRLVSEIKKSSIASILIFNCVIIPCTYFLAAFPTLGPGGTMNYIFKENATWILWLGFVISNLFAIICIPMGGLQEPVAQIIQQTWTQKVRAYIKKIHTLLVDYDPSIEEAESELISEISAEQKNVEMWAKAINSLNSTGQGLTMALNMLWTFVPLGVLALNPRASTVTEIGILCLLSSMCMFYFGVALAVATKPNITWNREVTTMLYDAKVQNINIKLIQNRFRPWLDSHEINATRALGFKVTAKRLMQSLSFVGSMFTLVMYLILREELRTVL